MDRPLLFGCVIPVAVAVCVAVWFLAVCAIRAGQPARTTYDVSHYLPMANAIETGRPFAEKDRQWPVGYPWLIVGLRRIGMGSNTGLIAFNVAALFVGLVLFGVIGVRDLQLSLAEVSGVIAASLASGITLDLTTIAQPEMAFLATTMGTLLCLSFARNSKRPALWFAAAIILAACSALLRTIGIALFPAIPFAAFRVPSLHAQVRHPRWVAVLAAVALVGCFLITQTHYFSVLVDRFRVSGAWFVLSSCPYWRLEELGQVFTNLTRPALPLVVQYELPFIGLAALAAIIFGSWRSRSSSLVVYLACYGAMLSLWTFWDLVRFYSPVLPCVFALAWIGARDVWRDARSRLIRAAQ
jgi:hypothetical protein